MKDSNIYIPLWHKYKSAIVTKLIQSLLEPQEYQLFKHEFEDIGDRTSAGYSFNLEIENGNVKNNIVGNAVARDLFEVLKNSSTAKELMNENYFKINFTTDFILKIVTIK